jgi:hypothetical protein
MAGLVRDIHFPPNCGVDLDKPLLFNAYQQQFQEARRLRYCLVCKTVGSMDMQGGFTCTTCQTVHTSNLTAPRVYDRLLVLSGRGGGKTLIGAHAVREEMMVPNSIGWVMGPTYKILHDSTFPTLIKLIPKDWVKKWDQEHMELTLKNNAMVAFRSLEDPERARGPHGVSYGWFDESAQSPERAYDVFEPTLIAAGGIIICTTTVLGFDWSYDKIEMRAGTEPGYWAIKYWTEENPLFKKNPTMMAQIERARRTMSPEFFAQEYRAERLNAQGLVYDFKVLEQQYLSDANAVKRLIPEWPKIDPSRVVLVGLDSGVDHPFGALKVVVTEKGLVVVGAYLERGQALSNMPYLLTQRFELHDRQVRWSANKNEASLRLEFAMKGIGIVQAESAHEVGIERVKSWLYSGQLYFAYTALDAFKQMQTYRYATNTATDGQKKDKEQVFKQKDELPDCLRYIVMAWPSLPVPELVSDSGRNLTGLDQKARWEVEEMARLTKKAHSTDLRPNDPGYPLGDFWESVGGLFE